MTSQQLYLAIGIPILFNAALIGVLIAYVNAKFEGLEWRFKGIDQRFEGFDQRFAIIDQRFAMIGQRFDALDRRFDEMRDLWRAELRRVEEVLDARLKHLEGR